MLHFGLISIVFWDFGYDVSTVIRRYDIRPDDMLSVVQLRDNVRVKLPIDWQAPHKLEARNGLSDVFAWQPVNNSRRRASTIK